ncbi:MAG: Polyketide cyclase / dehydrase and lipid transport, partial [Pseudonocardiales bacterium]|nr:Polyketide cyclase / dehydrase and lipid transport [Pseudonocardiales bacterium]
MTRWYPLEAADETFFDTAPYVYRYPVELPVAPERVWASLTSDRALAAWGFGLHSLDWTSPRPFGVGTTRSVVLPGRTIAIHERFFRWEEGRRKSFHGTETNRPLLRRFAEDYLVEPTAAGSRFIWT